MSNFTRARGASSNVCVVRAFRRGLAILFVFLACSLILAPTPARAQCDDICLPNEVVVDEGPTWCRCRDRQKFQACIADADANIAVDRRNCALSAQGIVADYFDGLADITGRRCARRLLAQGMEWQDVAARCILQLPTYLLGDLRAKAKECSARVAQNRRMREANCRKAED